jgi:hypothetical protein
MDEDQEGHDAHYVSRLILVYAATPITPPRKNKKLMILFIYEVKKRAKINISNIKFYPPP